MRFLFPDCKKILLQKDNCKNLPKYFLDSFLNKNTRERWSTLQQKSRLKTQQELFDSITKTILITFSSAIIQENLACILFDLFSLLMSSKCIYVQSTGLAHIIYVIYIYSYIHSFFYKKLRPIGLVGRFLKFQDIIANKSFL